jgi:glycolate oxidase iron-sulfur subunit
MDPRELVDYAKSLDCIHCGLCLRTCPTYRLTGEEASSPRGRIYLMRGVAEGEIDPADPALQEELDFCLVCRHCESVCPAGVRFGEMMETARDRLVPAVRRPLAVRFLRWLGFRLVLPSRSWQSAASSCLRLLQRTGLDRLSRLARSLPRVPPREERAALPARTPAEGEKRAEVAVLEGCAMRELYGRVNRATVRTLARLGVECLTAPEHACCGALHAHNGDLEGARMLARRTIAAFEALRGDGGTPLALVVNSAGCGAHLRDVGRLLADDPAFAERARAFAARVVDFSVFAARHAPADFAPSGRGLGRIAYDDPCHLCHGQGVRKEPRALLDRLVGCERVELPDSESCCGSAGIYSLLRPADSRAVFDAKLAALEATGADVLVTANPGCQMQWEAGLARAGSRVRVVHLAELLARDDPGAPPGG